MKTWAQRAVTELLARGWTAADIARFTGLSPGTVADLKHGRVGEPRMLKRALLLREMHEYGILGEHRS